jgi:hypothetical protein
MSEREKCVDPKTLSTLIGKGKKFRGVEETNDYTLKPKVLASTLGMALIGKCGSSEAALKIWGEWEKQCPSENKTYTEKLSELLNIPLEVVERIARLTYEGKEAAEIMKMLRKGEVSF